MKNNEKLIGKLKSICELHGYVFRAHPIGGDEGFLNPSINRPNNHPRHMPEVYVRETKDYDIESFEIQTTSIGAVDYETAKQVSDQFFNAVVMVGELNEAVKSI